MEGGIPIEGGENRSARRGVALIIRRLPPIRHGRIALAHRRFPGGPLRTKYGTMGTVVTLVL